jgi:multidrug resistance efflux pump
MKTKDQILLENAYNQVVEENWKGALTAAAMAAASLLGSSSTAKADAFDRPATSIEQTKKITAEDLIPRKEFDQVLDMMRQAVAKGDYKSAKQIYNIVHDECENAVMKVQGSSEMKKIADMDAEALTIWNNAYLGVVKTGLGAMANSVKAAE